MCGYVTELAFVFVPLLIYFFAILRSWACPMCLSTNISVNQQGCLSALFHSLCVCVCVCVWGGEVLTT